MSSRVIQSKHIYDAGFHEFYTYGTGALNSNIGILNSVQTMTIKNGNVGIGTATPTQKLHIEGNIFAKGNVTCSNISVIGDFVTLNTITSNTEQVVIENAGTGPALKVTQTGNNSVAEFYDNESGLALFVGNGGNIGIGTNNPMAKLDVNGNMNVSGNISAGNLGMFRNRIINGNFDIWQRGTSFNVITSYTYTADRWSLLYDGSGATRTISRQAFALGQTDVPNEPIYYVRYNQSVAGTGGTYSIFENRIEGVRTFGNQTVTTSFYAKANTTISNLNLIFRQSFGAGGSPSAVTYTIGPLFTLTSTWTKYQFTLSIPSVSGKTLGTDGNDFIGMYISMPNNSTFTIDFSQFQVELGNIATPFEFRPYGIELQLCQRYYQQFNYGGLTFGSAGATAFVATKFSTTDAIIINIPLSDSMRVAPSTNLSTSTVRGVFNSGAATVTYSSSYSTSMGPAVISFTNNAVGAGFGWVDQLGIFTLNAEL